MGLLEIENLSVERSARPVLQGLTTGAARGEMIGVIGPNGAGKSTLLRALAGLQDYQQGDILWKGRSLARWSEAQRAPWLGYMAQQQQPAWPLSVEQLVLLGRSPLRARWQRVSAEDRQAVAAAMANTDVTRFAERPVGELSGGELQRVLLARVLAGEPEVIVADEPIAALDPYHQLHIMELLAGQASAGGLVLVALHDLGLAARFCSRLWLLDGGRLVAAGSPAAVLREETLEAVYHIKTKMVCEAAGVGIIPVQRLSMD